ncbi:hypothetical protein D3C86_1754000 [compost metagenome]
MNSICGRNVLWQDWVKDPELLQLSLNGFIALVLGRGNSHDAELEYTSGLRLSTDCEYLMLRGELEGRIITSYPELKSYIKNGRAKDLKYTVVDKAMLKLSGGKFIPIQFLNLFRELQAVRPG